MTSSYLGEIMIWTVPNILTLARLVLLVPICLLIMGGWTAHALAFVLYVIACLTDFLDGYIARAHNQGSDFGRMLDPVVDKIVVAALFIMLVADGTLSGLWLACPILILSREFLIAGLREYLGPKGIVIPVSKLAKWKTTSQMVAIGLLLFPGMAVPGLFVLLIATILTVMTATHYLRGVKF